MNYEIYAETSQNLNNGNTIQRNQMRAAQIQQSNQKIYSSERPVFPPPPVPTQNHLSDLQQIQQQMIKKKQTDYNAGVNFNGNNHSNHQFDETVGSSDLPPPPSPPSNLDNHVNGQQIIQNMMKLNMTDTHKNSEDFDMPLPPPPPMDLPDSYVNNLPPPLPDNHQNNNMSHSHTDLGNMNGNNLPPPPPLPPLVESDTVSTSSSASINNTPTQSKSADVSKNDEVKVARGSYLDDINQRRFQLKSSKREANGSNGNNSIMSDGKEGGDTIQPFVNNSDVAAIIDFIRKFRPHVRDSSEEDEENSDWDE